MLKMEILHLDTMDIVGEKKTHYYKEKNKSVWLKLKVLLYSIYLFFCVVRTGEKKSVERFLFWTNKKDFYVSKAFNQNQNLLQIRDSMWSTRASDSA